MFTPAVTSGYRRRDDAEARSDPHEQGLQELERTKRDFLKLEDLKIGDGPVAAWNRRIAADIEIRYIDGTLVHKGPVYTHVGFHIALEGRFGYDTRYLKGAPGIRLGLNGMAVGGRRRITINPRWFVVSATWMRFDHSRFDWQRRNQS